VRHVIVEAIKAGDEKTIEHDETPAIEDKSDRDPEVVPLPETAG
jgi:hypothetical protein